jgi:mRNA-degrading endonuclease YafQ of YafQ-DinJ toxin-antitoxin module
LRLLATDPYNPILRTHKLKGKLSGAWACSVEDDCRIVFSFAKNKEQRIGLKYIEVFETIALGI